MKWLAVMLFALVGCVRSEVTTCADGSLCPSGYTCASITTLLGMQRTQCVSPDQSAACADKQDGTECDLPGTTGGACHSGACVFAECGNGLLDPGEVCDDANVADGDTCSSTCTSDLTCGNGVVDPKEQCDLGDQASHDGCTSTCKAEQPRWVELASERPGARQFAALAYDRVRRRVVLFGGARKVGPQFLPLADTLEWDGVRWNAAPSGIAPSNRYANAMAYDAARDQLVVFSGVNNQPDTWIRVDGAWQQLTPPGDQPPARDYAGMVYEASRKRLVLFGGFSAETQDNLDDTWTWDGTHWQAVTPATRPTPRLGFAMAYDPKRDVTVLFGGFAPDYSDDVWEFDGTNWANRTPSVPGPSPRAFAAMTYDPSTGEILMSGGSNAGGPQGDVFSWDGSRWQARPVPVTTGTGDALVTHAMATDPVRGRVVLLDATGTIHEWSAPAWTTPPGGTAGATPEARDGAALALDPVRDELVMFGGTSASSVLLDETWRWISGWGRVVTGATPPARTRAVIAYDEARREVVMYGGCTIADALADTWIWKDGTWTEHHPVSSPGKRCDAAMTYDAARGKLVLVGGHDGAQPATYASTTWTWDGTTWMAEPTSTTPPPRAAPAIAYDRVRERVVLFGGARPPGPPSRFDYTETWIWDGTAWTRAESPTVPPGRTRAQLAWEPARARIILAGGTSTEGGYTFSDAYEWDGASWSSIPGDYLARQNQAMTTATDGAGVLMFGGNALASVGGVQQRLADTWRLRWDGDASYEACTDRDGDGDGLVGCLDPDCWWTCTPTCSPGTTCAADGPRCGDQVCNTQLESCASCPGDCGTCPVQCGDFTCSAGETGCPGDCP